ncbi:MAG: bifunctional oligoribonuclease/PAP phosphatase NrnA [Ruminococcaceae bacterium]|nr:bifunctional oligoribonuclease/PAP phosphatase NrnA [Oscillospiraceae bacterium]
MKAIAETIKQAESVIILAHVGEDADAFGSGLALLEMIRNLGKKAEFYVSQEPEWRLRFLEKNYRVYTEETEVPAYDLCIAIDCGDKKRMDTREILFDRAEKTVNIDHHYTNPGYAQFNYVDGNAAATAEILYRLFSEMQVAITDSMAKNLYLAIMSDSGCLKYSCASAETVHTVGELMRFEFDHAELCRRLFDSEIFEVVQLKAHIMLNLHRYYDGKLCIANITEEMLQKYGVAEKDTGDFVNIPRELFGTEIAVSLTQTPDKIKLSFRSNGQHNVAELAGRLGGGGHTMAAGARLFETTPEEAEEIIVALCKELLA